MLRDNQLRAKMVRLTLALLMLLAGSMTLLSMVGPLRADWTATDTTLAAGTTTVIFLLYGLAGFGYFALLLASGTAFLLWLYRAYDNLHHLPATRPRYAAAWAVGAWFVPVLNLVRPYFIVREVWQGTQQAACRRVVESATVVGWWWAALLGQLVVAWVAGQLGSAFHNQPVAQDVPAATLLDAGVRLLAAALTWHLVGRCTRFEEQLLAWQLLDQLGQPASAAELTTEQPQYGQLEGY